MNLVELVRPTSFEDMVGQPHLFRRGEAFFNALKSASNLIFYGPSGTGKTTVAKIIAKNSNRDFYSFNATDCSVSDLKKVVAKSTDLFSHTGILIYLDEIQYFNKKQQQSLLSFLDEGRVVLVASTTENPFFSVYGALLSRCLVFEFKVVDRAEICRALTRASSIFKEYYGSNIEIENGVFEVLAGCCGGDVRRGINLLEVCLKTTQKEVLTRSLVDEILQSFVTLNGVDLDCDEFFDLLSALQKSIRGSDENAAIYYLARILNERTLKAVCRRMLVIASEDIGLANSNAIVVVKACVDAAIQVGMPQARIVLAHAVIFLALSPKSNSCYKAINRALEKVKLAPHLEILYHLKNKRFDAAAECGDLNTCSYKNPHEFKNNYVKQQYLPDGLERAVFFEFGSNKYEQAAKAYRQKLLNDLE